VHVLVHVLTDDAAAKTSASATPAPRRPGTDPSVLEVFPRGAPRIAADTRFTHHVHADGTMNWDTVIRAPGRNDGQRSLIHRAAALCGGGRVPPGTLGAHLTGRQTSPVLAMCQAARRRKPADLGACQGRDLDGSARRQYVTLMATERVVIGTTTC
jgi:hypothetical protein